MNQEYKSSSTEKKRKEEDIEEIHVVFLLLSLHMANMLL